MQEELRELEKRKARQLAELLGEALPEGAISGFGATGLRGPAAGRGRAGGADEHGEGLLQAS